METFIEITNIFTLVAVLALAAERLISGGWFNLRIGKNGFMHRDKDDSVRNGLQPLLSQMELLTKHFNHETSTQNTAVLNELRDIRNSLDSVSRKLDTTISHLDSIRMDGVRTRD